MQLLHASGHGWCLLCMSGHLSHAMTLMCLSRCLVGGSSIIFLPKLNNIGLISQCELQVVPTI